jgi:hypothetical protein
MHWIPRQACIHPYLLRKSQTGDIGERVVFRDASRTGSSGFPLCEKAAKGIWRLSGSWHNYLCKDQSLDAAQPCIIVSFCFAAPSHSFVYNGTQNMKPRPVYQAMLIGQGQGGENPAEARS